MIVVGQHGREASGDRNEWEGVQPGHSAGGVLPLQTDQQAEQDRNAHLLKRRLHQYECSVTADSDRDLCLSVGVVMREMHHSR